MSTLLYRLLSSSCSEMRRMPRPKLDVANIIKSSEYVRQNMANRGMEDLRPIDRLIEVSNQMGPDSDEAIEQAMLIPNSTAESVANLKSPKVIMEKKYLGPFNIDVKRYGEFGPLRSFEVIGHRVLHGVRMNELSIFNGDRSYFLVTNLAKLERALIRFVVRELVKTYNFKLVSVPDLLNPDIVKGCGMSVDGARTQVYRLRNPDLVLSGTSEMAMAGLHCNRVQGELPHRLVSVSRCFRAETSERKEEKSIYRVRHFTKVEMFIISKPSQSEALFNEIVDIQSEIFTKLNLAFRVLDMPPHELGLPAHRKIDMEAYLPGSQRYGEISSASNCTDFQARHLNITFKDDNMLNKDNMDFCHTLNGTACAVPRTIMAICEQLQLPNGLVSLPEVLRPYMGNVRLLEPERKKRRPVFNFVRSPHAFHQ